ncbi:MAG: DUF1573 domain-containing protein [Bacteroidota bacterium]
MKKNLLTLIVAALLFSVNTFAQEGAQPTAPATPEVTEENNDGPKMTFEFTEVDYGTIVQNADPLRVFPFVNDGTEPLVIKYAKGSCGCTVPEYPKQPIMPGESGEIKVKYDTKRIGPFNKSVRITTNISETPLILKIKGIVNKEEEGLPTKPTNSLINGSK